MDKQPLIDTNWRDPGGQQRASPNIDSQGWMASIANPTALSRGISYNIARAYVCTDNTPCEFRRCPPMEKWNNETC